MDKIDLTNFSSSDDFDDWLIEEVEKYNQIDFILWLEKEIELFIKEENNINFPFNRLKASFFDSIIYWLYISAYMWEIESKEVKNKLIEVFDFIENNYVDSNKLALSGLRDYRKKYLI